MRQREKSERDRRIKEDEINNERREMHGILVFKKLKLQLIYKLESGDMNHVDLVYEKKIRRVNRDTNHSQTLKAGKNKENIHCERLLDAHT